MLALEGLCKAFLRLEGLGGIGCPAEASVVQSPVGKLQKEGEIKKKYTKLPDKVVFFEIASFYRVLTASVVPTNLHLVLC